MSWKEIFNLMNKERKQNNVIQFPRSENAQVKKQKNDFPDLNKYYYNSSYKNAFVVHIPNEGKRTPFERYKFKYLGGVSGLSLIHI